MVRERARVKVCGITTLGDAELVCGLGADWLGFNFYRGSPRYVEPGAAAKVVEGLPEGVVAVGLFVNASLAEIAAVLEVCPVPVVQLHGDEGPGLCREVARLGVEVMKALRLRGPGDVGRLGEYDTDYLLVDAFHEGLYGGTGETFDWGWIRAVEGVKLFLAGGIGPENVARALAVGTWGVDVCSSVESRPGVKDTAKMRRLFEAIEGYYGGR